MKKTINFIGKAIMMAAAVYAAYAFFYMCAIITQALGQV